jgi:drug/metabolite transporter (DMT)-like permease
MNERQKAYLYLIITTAAWGSLYVAGKYIVQHIPAYTLLFLRYCIAVCILYFLYKKSPHKKVEKGDLKYLMAIGFFGYFGGIGLQLAAIKYCDASLASLINSTNPIVIILLAIPILKEKVTLHKLIAIGITILGAGIIIGHVEGGGVTVGILLSVLSVLAWSFSTVLVRLVSSKYDTLTITLYGMTVAIFCAFPVSAFQIVKDGTTWSDVTPGVVAAVLYVGIICTSLALFLWNKALSMADAATCSLFYPIQPLVSALLGTMLLGEVITVRFIFGGLLIIAGILYSVLMDAKTADVKVSGKIGQGNAKEKP